MFAETVSSEIAAILIVAGPVLGGAAVWVWNARNANRRNSITEWIAISDGKEARINAMQTQMNELALRCSRSEVAEARCQGQVGVLRIEMEHANDQLRRMQERMGDLPPGVTPPSEIIADAAGIIKWASASVGSMFHWLPAELIGKNIAVLMPKEMQPIHKRGLELLVKEGRKPDPAKPIFSFAITKDGKKFPVAINLSGWEAEPGKSYINAEIRRRGDSDLFTMIVPPTSGDSEQKLD